METNDFFTKLPTGKADKPILLPTGPLMYDFHDTDGLYFMLDENLSGCFVMMWTKPMNPEIKGKVAIDGEEVENCVLQPMELMNHMWILGIPLRGKVTEYDKTYLLHIEGYCDMDGNRMEPAEFPIQGPAFVEADPKYAENEKIALQAVEEGIVLLENEGNLLPLKQGEVLNLFGRGVHEFRNGAVGAGKITPRYSRNFVEAVREGEEFQLNEELVSFYRCDHDWIPSEEMLSNARALSDTAIMMITRAAGENMDLSTAEGEYYLSREERALLEVLSENFDKVVAILNVGYPIDVRFVKELHIDAVLYVGFGGMLGGPAIVNILSGKTNPSGKLPDTWALDYTDIPAGKNFYNCVDKPRLVAESPEYLDTYYEEGIYVGYRYFRSFGVKTAYPFGYGLSYTVFIIETEKIQYDTDGLTMKIFVKNIGNTAGKEVVQVYIRKPETILEQAERELIWFGKTKELEPGECQEFRFSVEKKYLTSYSEKDAAYLLSEGKYIVFAGKSVEAHACGEFYVYNREVIKQVKNRMQPQVSFTELSRRRVKTTYPQGKKSGVAYGKTTFFPYAKRAEYSAKFENVQSCEKLTYSDVKDAPEKLPAFISQLTIEELARISVCASAGWGMEGIGEAGRIFKMEGLELPDFPVSDGNSGVNLRIPNIGMPSGVTICASFNKELAKQIGEVIGKEAKELKMPMILAPALNIHRNPLNGRQPEYFSEDPYLAGVMSGYYSEGLESEGVAACVKHLVANNCESSRKRNQSILSERTLREIYFKAFEISMETHMPAAVMTAYNACNGRPTAADPDLILGLLREENGFDGFVMTDWTSYDTVDVAEMAAAGNCWITPGSTDDTYTSQIVKGVEDGIVAIERLRENVYWIIHTLIRFDRKENEDETLL